VNLLDLAAGSTLSSNPDARLHPSQLCLIHFDGNLCAFVENLNRD
jgi:hypothetical protein